ncbi:DUF5990 family protein [Actinoplanes sp. NBRC 103695]|uniref:DUF5990 family protein n=1 Tax=Actinoplanes sp. NBRC 103695 TaxID=3032202 RepID=UPI0024A1B7C2|nr:DUF5990 family protein [Actinoplanes sp. NBRC 103695]GLY95046.1 hypothetical protein Acsp02_23010 [Actinoplanes sp. NBRC 103695]
MRIRIEGSDLPGRRAGSTADELRLANVHVGVQRKDRPESLVPASAPSATWDLEVTSRTVAEGALDVGGPWVHGRPGARFLYLTWGAVTGDRFDMFRRAKLLFTDIPGDALLAAHAGAATLVGRLGLTGGDGGPICARVRPPTITWTAE